jgi:uncharacterized membrane protein
MNQRFPRIIFLVLIAAASIHFGRAYPLLTEVMASHFDQHGIANGWETKQTFFEMFGGLTILSAILVFGLGKLIAVMPAQFINLPNRQYWLGPGQRGASISYLDSWFAWFGCAVYAVIVVAFDYAVETNLHAPQAISPVRLWFVLAFFTGFTIYWTVLLLRRFGRPRARIR